MRGKIKELECRLNEALQQPVQDQSQKQPSPCKKRPLDSEDSTNLQSKQIKKERAYNIVLAKFPGDGKLYLAKINKKTQKVRYCETEVKQLKGRMEIANEYKFNNFDSPQIPEKNIIKTLPDKFQELTKQNNIHTVVI